MEKITTDFDEDILDDSIEEVLDSAMLYVTNEPIMLLRAETFLFPDLSKIDQDKNFNERLDRAVRHLGGPPRQILIRENDPMPKIDTYPEAVLREMVAMFYRCRKSVSRSLVYYYGCEMQRTNPERFGDDASLALRFNSVSYSAFWENVESAYIRLSSYWDRVAQVLDFAFFKIRHFERDGFKAVADKIHNNVASISQEFKELTSWKSVRKYQNSEKNDGLAWLTKRRNIIIHSLHLRAMEAPVDQGAFKPMYNHLEEKFTSKLTPGTPSEEVELLQFHLKQAAILFDDILKIIEFSALYQPQPSYLNSNSRS